MTLTEFEEKLSTVSEAKLRQMLAASLAKGPEVAAKLILAECNERGMGGLEPMSDIEASRKYAAARSTIMENDTTEPQASVSSPAYDSVEVPNLNDASAAPNWLTEETKSGLPVAVKLLILVVAIGSILGLAWKFTH